MSDWFAGGVNTLQGSDNLHISPYIPIPAGGLHTALTSNHILASCVPHTATNLIAACPLCAGGVDAALGSDKHAGKLPARSRRRTILALAACMLLLGLMAIASTHRTSSRQELRRSARIDSGTQREQGHTVTVEECWDGHCSSEVVRVHDAATTAKRTDSEGAAPPDNVTDAAGQVTVEKIVGKPLKVTVMDSTNSSQTVESGGSLVTDNALAKQVNPGKLPEGDNVQDLHRPKMTDDENDA